MTTWTVAATAVPAGKRRCKWRGKSPMKPEDRQFVRERVPVRKRAPTKSQRRDLALLRCKSCDECKKRDRLIVDRCPYCTDRERIICDRCSRLILEHL